MNTPKEQSKLAQLQALKSRGEALQAEIAIRARLGDPEAAFHSTMAQLAQALLEEQIETATAEAATEAKLLRLAEFIGIGEDAEVITEFSPRTFSHSVVVGAVVLTKTGANTVLANAVLEGIPPGTYRLVATPVVMDEDAVPAGMVQ